MESYATRIFILILLFKRHMAYGLEHIALKGFAK